MSNKPNDGGPAFPQNDAAVNRINNHDGMTLRDYFAAKAMAAIIQDTIHAGESAFTASRIAYGVADSMIAIRDELTNRPASTAQTPCPSCGKIECGMDGSTCLGPDEN